MDLSDLLLILFIAAGLLSSLLSGTKKHKGRPRVPAPPRSRPRPAERVPSPPGEGGGATAGPEGGPRVLSEMESILRELGLEVERRREAEVEAPGPTTPVGWEPVPPRREEGQPTAAYAPPPPIPPIAEPRYAAVSEIEDDEKRHEEFHQRYMAPTASRTRVSAPRIRRRLRLTRRALRDAVVWREILGPPKGLR